MTTLQLGTGGLDAALQALTQQQSQQHGGGRQPHQQHQQQQQHGRASTAPGSGGRGGGGHDDMGTLDDVLAQLSRLQQAPPLPFQ